MAISVKEAAVYFAMAESAEQGGSEVAIRFEANGKIIAIGINDARSVYDARSAIINVLQNSKSTQETFIATSYLADNTDEKSLGMCAMQKIKRVYFLNKKKICSLKNQVGKETPWKEVIPMNKFEGKQVSFNSLDSTSPKEWLNQIAANPPKPTTDSVTAYMYKCYKKATRFNYFENFPDLTLPANLPSPGRRVNNALRHEIFNKLAWAIVGEAISQRSIRYPDGHNIGSVLRGPEDQILAWGINTGSGSQNNTLHGEVNLILNYRKHTIQGKAIGEGLANDEKPIVYSTLEPCHMCAGIIAAGGDHLTCYYSQIDEGIKKNALKRKSHDSSQLVIDEIPLIRKGANRMGRLMNFVYLFERGYINREPHKGVKKKPAVTSVLNREVQGRLILLVINDYFDLVPKGTQERKTWDTSEEKIIWEAGFELLQHINPGVKAKWEAYHRALPRISSPD